MMFSIQTTVFFYGCYMKHHVTYLIMLLINFSSTAILIMSPEMLFRISFCSGVSIRGTKC
jgi:hypothetical protein